jgi:hypothetical protein
MQVLVIRIGVVAAEIQSQRPSGVQTPLSGRLARAL